MTRHKPHPRFRCPAFTLVELLVVITIIIVLAAISVSVVRSVRNSAGTAKTVLNLRQVQAVNGIFASDNGGFFLGNSPGGTGPWNPAWFTYMPFVSMLGVNATGDGESGNELPDGWGKNYPEVLKCGIPVSVSTNPVEKDRNFTIAMNWTNFTHNYDGSPFNGNWWSGGGGKILQSRVKYPEKLIMFYESTEIWGNYDSRLDWKQDNAGFNRGLAFRNKGGGCNVVFADGHVGSLTRKDIQKDNSVSKRYFYWDAN